MGTDHTPNSAKRATKLASLAALLAVAAGAMVLVGWAFDIATLKSVLSGWVAMKANTAACFILIGVALWLTARPQRSIFFSRFARFCGLLVGLIGLLALCEYISLFWPIARLKNEQVENWLFDNWVNPI